MRPKQPARPSSTGASADWRWIPYNNSQVEIDGKTIGSVETAGPTLVSAAAKMSESTDVCVQAADALAQRLLARATNETPGFLVLNPCSFTRRVALEIAGMLAPLEVAGPVKACQLDGDLARLVVEAPALGFAWFPRIGTTSGTSSPSRRMVLASPGNNHLPPTLRNEFFEADIDPDSGMLWRDGCPGPLREVFLDGTAPTHYCPVGILGNILRRVFFDKEHFDEPPAITLDQFRRWADEVDRERQNVQGALDRLRKIFGD